MSRPLLITAVVWLVALAGGAVVFDWHQRHRESPELLGRALLHNVELEDAGIVLIETPGGQVTLRRTVWGWEVDEQNGFVADADKLRALLLRLANARIAQRVPVGKQRLGDLGLLQKVENQWRFEAGRTASVFSIIHGLELKHKLMYQVLIGNHRAGSGTYVRFPDDRKVYLVAEDLALDGDATHWIRRRVFDRDAPEAMRRIRIREPGRGALTLSRADATAPWRPAGPGRALPAARVAELTRTLAELRVATVGAPVDPAPAAPARASIEVEFFDRRAVTMALGDARRPEGHRPALLSAGLSGEDADERARWRVKIFNRYYGGRVVELDAEQSRRLFPPQAQRAAAR